MVWTCWRQHFERNATRSVPFVVDATRGLTEDQVYELGLTLARFQLGETGEGRIAHEIRKFDDPAIDDDYREALGLFVGEEGRHARILGRCVRSLGGPRLSGAWTEDLFRHGRGLAGVRLKLIVLLSAEVIAVGFYGDIVEALPEGSLRNALEQIVNDEDAHMDFHTDFFSSQLRSPAAKLAFRAAWWSVATSACSVVLWDHRKTLTAFGLSRRATARRLVGLIGKVEGDVLSAAAAAATVSAREWKVAV
jgi:hypothetical protein